MKKTHKTDFSLIEIVNWNMNSNKSMNYDKSNTGRN